MWFKKNENNRLNSDEYELLSKRITELLSRIEETLIKVKIQETNLDNLRGNFNAKLNKLKKGEIEEDKPQEMEESKSINNNVLIPHNGFFK